MATKFPKIKIVYCAECGYEDICLNVVGRLMREFDMRLDSITILPAAGGQLEISVDEDLIHSTLRTGKFPKDDEIVTQVRQRLE
jgi:selenoprotein W-related protein